VGTRSLRTALALALAALPATAGTATGAEPAPAAGERERSIGVVGGLAGFTLAADVELQTRLGVVIAAGGGDSRGPALNAYVGYNVPLSRHWSLRPGMLAVRSWQIVSSCPTRCRFDAYVASAAIRYRGSSGFVFEYGLPLLGWLPVGPDVGETQPHLKFYTIATPDMFFFETLVIGWSFDI
jgi:hypothetical protein